jgi:hypothetical protein
LEIIEEAFACVDLGKPNRPVRTDVVLVHVTNTGDARYHFRPQLIVDTALTFEFRADTQRVVVNHQDTITASLPMTGMRSRQHIYLKSQHLAAGTTATFCIAYSNDNTTAVEPITVEQAVAMRDRAVTY